MPSPCLIPKSCNDRAADGIAAMDFAMVCLAESERAAPMAALQTGQCRSQLLRPHHLRQERRHHRSAISRNVLPLRGLIGPQAKMFGSNKKAAVLGGSSTAAKRAGPESCHARNLV